MKKERFLFRKVLMAIFLIVNIIANGSAVIARNLEEIKKSGVLKVAIDGTTPPFNYYKGAELTGLEVDLIGEIARRIGLKIVWTVQPFNTLLIAISQDRFDLIATSHTITPERSKIVDFITPHYCTSAYIIAKPNGPLKVSDLDGKTVSVAVGTVYFDKLKTVPNIKQIITVPNETEGLMALFNNRADAWVTQKAIAMSALQMQPKEIDLRIGEPILKQVNAMVIAKGNNELQKLINENLEILMHDGSYEKLMESYLVGDLYCK